MSYHLHMQSQFDSIMQPAQSNDGISIQRAWQDALPAVYQVISHGPALNLTITIGREQPWSYTHTNASIWLKNSTLKLWKKSTKVKLTWLVPFQTGNDLSVTRVDGEDIPGVLSVDDMDHVTDIWNTGLDRWNQQLDVCVVMCVCLCVPFSLSSLFRSVVNATRFLQDHEHTTGMDGQWAFFCRFSHSQTYASSMSNKEE